jgi:hypothetical protein
MQRPLTGYDSLHSTLVACVSDIIKPIKMYNVNYNINIKILKY